jgi:hypothetical protein
MGELQQISWLSAHLVAKNATLLQGNVILTLSMNDAMLEIYVGSDLLYLTSKACLMLCGSCCCFYPEADAVFPRNVDHSRRRIYYSMYIF